MARPPPRRYAATMRDTGGLRPASLTLAALIVVAALALPARAGAAIRPQAAPAAATPPPAAVAAPLPQIPSAWPSHGLEIGLMDSPGGAAALHASGAYKFRYQYLCGGVNTGAGWATWNTGAKFADYYVDESVAAGITPVFIYYQMLQSKPAGGAEKDADLNNLKNATTMKAYWADWRLLMQHLGVYSQTIVIDVEPDLWGYIQQAATGDDATTIPAAVASSGDADMAGLPNDAAGFARGFIRLRDKYAPNVLLGYHMSTWGTLNDPIYQNLPLDQINLLADRSAAFEQSLGASFDLAFGDPSDRDAGFKQANYGQGTEAWWDNADYARWDEWMGRFSRAAGLRMVLWQIPLGNTKMRAMDNTWGHYQDNHVEWWLGDGNAANLTATLNSGVIALLYGGGADGTTSASDARGDGVTNPAPINGNTTASYSADDDGGYFRHQVTAYYTAGAVPLPGAGFMSAARSAPAVVLRGSNLAITSTVVAAASRTVLVEVEIDDPSGAKVTGWSHDGVSLSAGVERSFTDSWSVPASATVGQYTVSIAIRPAGGGEILSWNPNATAFAVRAGGTYVPLPPVRVLDTRDGTGGLSGRFISGKPRTVQIAGAGSVPDGAIAVTGNLTVTGQTSGGYVTLGPTVASKPAFSTLNFPLRDDRANGVTVALAGDGSLQAVFVGAGSSAGTHLVLDITGYFAPDFAQGGYHALMPYRALDTRDGTGGLSGKFVAGQPRTFALGSAVPSTAVAVTGNLTVTGQSARGFIALGPTVLSEPDFSTLNFPIADNRANNVTVGLGPDGTLQAVYAAARGATTNLVFDVTGYYEPGSGGAVYVAMSPVRAVDSRIAQGLPGPLRHGSINTISLATILPEGSVAISANVTVTGQSKGGYVALAPALSWPPSTSTLNFPLRDNRANGAVVPVTAGRDLQVVLFSRSGATTQVILDVMGYFVPAP